MTTRRSSWRSAPQPRARPQGRPLQAVHAAQRSHAAALRGGQVAPRPSRIDVRGRARRWKGTFDVIVLDLADPVECGPAFPLWSVRPRFLPPHASQRATPSAPRGHGCLPLPAPAGRARTRARECRPRQPRLRLLGPRPGMEHRGVSGKPCSTSAGNKEAHSFTAEKFHFLTLRLGTNTQNRAGPRSTTRRASTSWRRTASSSRRPARCPPTRSRRSAPPWCGGALPAGPQISRPAL